MPEYATNPVDIVKIAVMAWIGVYLVNYALRAAGLAGQTTRGQ